MSRHRHHKAKGGKVKGAVYEGGGSRTAAEAEDKTDGFKRGGKAKYKRGGKVEGHRAKHRGDRPKRSAGGRAGHSPMSSAAKVTGRPGGDYSAKVDPEDD